jgi:hypothetical protein
MCFLALLGLLSCGLETLYYIDYIPPSNYVNETSSSVLLPSRGREGYGDDQYFTHFMIFYRIYLSNNNPTGRLDTQLSAIGNSALVSDYTMLYPLTNISSTTVDTSNLEIIFYNRRYFKLELEGEPIDNILSRGALGNLLEISFYDNAGQKPVLRLNGSHTLMRANSAPGIIFAPQPVDSRSFLNYPELCNHDNATSIFNADVVSPGADVRYTYVSMYIAAVGRSFEMPPRTIYSQPCFLGIFRLPNP